jgi:ABC-type glycerol-3-phosphate transport system substrate-binding protein
LTVGGALKAAPDEFSVDVLFYNPACFDEAGIGYPDRHWNWDILEADARALDSLKLKDGAGEAVYPVELAADFDLWNILCTQAGHPALDLGVWHLGDTDTKESQMRALDLIHEIFQELSVTAPLQKRGDRPGQFFAEQRAAVLIGPSDLTSTLPKFGYRLTVLPGDLERASLARVNGWAVTAQSTQTAAARALAGYLAVQPVHAGWSRVAKPADEDSPDAVCYEALGEALVPRIESKTAPMAEFLDQQIDLLARNAEEKTDDLYARIQAEFQREMPDSVVRSEGEKPDPKVEPAPQVRGL